MAPSAIFFAPVFTATVLGVSFALTEVLVFSFALLTFNLGAAVLETLTFEVFTLEAFIFEALACAPFMHSSQAEALRLTLAKVAAKTPAAKIRVVIFNILISPTLDTPKNGDDEHPQLTKVAAA
jgi:hypothetical protein